MLHVACFASYSEGESCAVDKAIWPFSYEAAGKEIGSPASFVGGADAAKEFIQKHCTTAIVSTKMMQYVIMNAGWEYNLLLNVRSQHGHLGTK